MEKKDTETRVNVVAKDGKADVSINKGPIIKELTDLSSVTFQTRDIHSFVQYVKNTGLTEPLYISDEGLTGKIVVDIFPTSEVDIYRNPAASLILEESGVVRLLFDNLEKWVSISEFEIILKVLMPYNGADLVNLYNNLRHLTISSINDIRRNIDNKGNFELVVKRENRPEMSFSPPEQITFNIPVYKSNTQDLYPLRFDLVFDYKIEGGTELKFKILAYDWDEQLRAAEKVILGKHFGELENQLYYGQSLLTKRDDSWKYKTYC